MNIAVFGTGSVGQALANRLAELSHAVVIGTRNVENAVAAIAAAPRAKPARRLCP